MKKIFVEQAGVDLNKLKPLDIVMPVNPRYTWQEWQEIFVAQVPSLRNNRSVKMGTESQTRKDLHHTLVYSS